MSRPQDTDPFRNNTSLGTDEAMQRRKGKRNQKDETRKKYRGKKRKKIRENESERNPFSEIMPEWFILQLECPPRRVFFIKNVFSTKYHPRLLVLIPSGGSFGPRPSKLRLRQISLGTTTGRGARLRCDDIHRHWLTEIKYKFLPIHFPDRYTTKQHHFVDHQCHRN